MGDPFQLDLEKYVDLKARLAEVDAEAKSIKAEMSAIEARLSEEFLSRGIQNIGLSCRDDGSTVYKFVSVDKARQEEAVAAAERLGLGEMIVLQPHRFSSWAKEMLANEGQLPDEFKPLARVHETTRIRVRKG